MMNDDNSEHTRKLEHLLTLILDGVTYAEELMTFTGRDYATCNSILDYYFKNVYPKSFNEILNTKSTQEKDEVKDE
jgi:hypothetical protein